MEKFEYPMWFKSVATSLVVKFSNLQSGDVIIGDKDFGIGEHSDNWVKHTDKKIWENVTYLYKETVSDEKTSIPPLELCGTPKSAMDIQIGGNHYKKMKIQPMEYSMANNLDAMQHTIIKYVSRFRDKNGIEDLEKAKHTIDMLIDWEKNNVSN